MNEIYIDCLIYQRGDATFWIESPISQDHPAIGPFKNEDDAALAAILLEPESCPNWIQLSNDLKDIVGAINERLRYLRSNNI